MLNFDEVAKKFARQKFGNTIFMNFCPEIPNIKFTKNFLSIVSIRDKIKYYLDYEESKDIYGVGKIIEEEKAKYMI